ncbi:MAG: radical SAM protein [Planctomycetota bacterium]
MCKQKLLQRISRFCNHTVNLSDWIGKDEIEGIEREIAKFPNPIKPNDLLKLQLDDVNVGKDIWQSIQRYLFMAAPEWVSISAGAVAYEYIKTGLIYALACKKIFNNIHYDFVLTNEVAYADWGIPSRMAVKSDIPVLHQHRLPAYSPTHFSVKTRLSEDIERYGYAPTAEELSKTYNDPVELQRYAIYGKKSLDNKFGPQKQSGQLHSLAKRNTCFRPGRKTVVVFAHVCWDSSITFGDKLFPTFEDWLKNTYEIARYVPQIDWVFRSHPHESYLYSSPHFNSLSLLKELNEKYPCEHIRIADGNTGMKTNEMIPFIHAGITAVGSVGFELPALGVPCIMACKAGVCDASFTIMPQTVQEYVSMLRSIDSVGPVTEKQKTFALGYIGLLFDTDRYLDVGGLFKDTGGPAGEVMDPTLIDIWLKNKPGNIEYIKREVERGLMASKAHWTKNQDTKSKGNIWLVAPGISGVELADLENRFNFYMPDHSWEDVNKVSRLPDEVIFSNDAVLLFGDEHLVPDQVRSNNKRFFDIDHRRCEVEGWNWPRLTVNYGNYKSDTEQAKKRFTASIDMVRAQGLTKAYLLGTGPSLEKAIERDFSDGYRIVCNTIVRDKNLWNHINPHFIVAGDGIYHFGHTSFPRAFRRDLKERLAQTQTFFVYPDLFDPIVQRELSDFAHRLLPIPSGGPQAINFDLTKNFALPGLHNVLGLLLLPLGCNLSSDINLWGFDGRAPDDKLFWSNSNKHSYTELVPELQKEHPAFFNHFAPKDDTSKYTKIAFGDILENAIATAEAQGWNFTMMHHSWTPVLAKRFNKVFDNNIVMQSKPELESGAQSAGADYSRIFGEKRICPNPFMSLEIHGDGNVSVCCTGRLNDGYKFIGNVLQKPLDEIWNSKEIQFFREVMYNGQYDRTCKHFCPQLIALKKGETPPWYSHLCNAETHREIADEKTVLDSSFRAVSIASDGSCNLSCIMCRQNKKIQPTEIERQVNQQLYNQILENISNITFLELTGNGDPFYNRDIGIFLERLAHEDIKHLTIRFITNGLLLNEKRFQQIESLNVKQLRVSVSIDAASKQIYESIRRGGSWEVLLRNMKMLSDMRVTGKLGYLQTSFCVMKRNIHEMLAFIALCRAWNCDKIEFQRIFGNTAGSENIFDQEDSESLIQLSGVINNPVFNEDWISASSLLSYRDYLPKSVACRAKMSFELA